MSATACSGHSKLEEASGSYYQLLHPPYFLLPKFQGSLYYYTQGHWATMLCLNQKINAQLQRHYYQAVLQINHGNFTSNANFTQNMKEIYTNFTRPNALNSWSFILQTILESEKNTKAKLIQQSHKIAGLPSFCCLERVHVQSKCQICLSFVFVVSGITSS